MRRSIAALVLAGLLVMTGGYSASAYSTGWTSVPYDINYTASGPISHGQKYTSSGQKYAFTKWSGYLVYVNVRYNSYGTWEYHGATHGNGYASITDWASFNQHESSY